MYWACVPLPAPGGPTRTSLMTGTTYAASRRGLARPQGAPRAWHASDRERRRRAPGRRALPKKTFVVAHHELRLDLLHRLETHADHDQHRGAAERELHALGQAEQHVRQHADR